MPLKVGILAGEPSGDALGAGLMRALQSRCSNDQEPIQFMGVGGPHMQAQALQCFADIDSLAVNGFPRSNFTATPAGPAVASF